MCRHGTIPFHNRVKQSVSTQCSLTLSIDSWLFEAPHKKELFFSIPASKLVNVFSSSGVQAIFWNVSLHDNYNQQKPPDHCNSSGVNGLSLYLLGNIRDVF